MIKFVFFNKIPNKLKKYFCTKINDFEIKIKFLKHFSPCLCIKTTFISKIHI